MAYDVNFHFPPGRSTRSPLGEQLSSAAGACLLWPPVPAHPRVASSIVIVPPPLRRAGPGNRQGPPALTRPRRGSCSTLCASVRVWSMSGSSYQRCESETTHVCTERHSIDTCCQRADRLPQPAAWRRSEAVGHRQGHRCGVWTDAYSAPAGHLTPSKAAAKTLQERTPSYWCCWTATGRRSRRSRRHVSERAAVQSTHYLTHPPPGTGLVSRRRARCVCASAQLEAREAAAERRQSRRLLLLLLSSAAALRLRSQYSVRVVAGEGKVFLRAVRRVGARCGA